MWLLWSILLVFDHLGVASVLTTYAALGPIYLTPTILLHHLPYLAVLARPLPFPIHALIELRGWVMYKGDRVALTLLAQPYPPDLFI